MRIDIKTVKGKDYIQFIDVDGHLYHIGPADNYDNWKLAFYLYGGGLGRIEWQFVMKMKWDLIERFGWDWSKEEDKKKYANLLGFLGKGKNGYVGFGEHAKWLRTEVERIYDRKAEEIDVWRKAIKDKFPDISERKTKLKQTVNYNRRLSKENLEKKRS